MTAGPEGRITESLLVDAHAHIHHCFDFSTYFSAALMNFRRAAISLGLPRSTPGCLMLAESAGEQAFARATDWLSSGGEGRWSLQPTDEPITLLAGANDGGKIAIVAGRQVVTREGLEVLGLGVGQDLPFGLPLEKTVCSVYDSSALPVVPWGFGKWWFGRGERVIELLENTPVPTLCLGDNVGRPRFAKTPRQFTLAAERGIPLLPGTDPLPLKWHEAMAGRYGLVLNRIEVTPTLGSAVKERLSSRTAEMPNYGDRMGLKGFVRSQSALRLHGKRGDGR